MAQVSARNTFSSTSIPRRLALPIRVDGAFIEPGEGLELHPATGDDQATHAGPGERAEAHGARPPVHHQLMCGQARCSEIEGAQTALRQGERHHFGMRRRALARNHPVYAERNQAATLSLENRRGKWPAAVALEVLSRARNDQAHAIFQRR